MSLETGSTQEQSLILAGLAESVWLYRVAKGPYIITISIDVKANLKQLVLTLHLN